jgi:hypothetical protein
MAPMATVWCLFTSHLSSKSTRSQGQAPSIRAARLMRLGKGKGYQKKDL